MANILIVEDEAQLAWGLSLNLKAEGYAVAIADCGERATEMLRTTEWDLVVLDLLLPDIHGLEILERIRAVHGNSRVIVLSAVASYDVRVSAFKAGADDYVLKPFSLPELLERVRVRLLSSPNQGEVRPIEVDVDRQRVMCYGRPVSLTPKEFDLLCCLMRADGKVVPVKELLAQVWGLPQTVSTRTADYHIQSLRRKLDRAGLPEAIRRVYGRGVAWALTRESTS